LNRRNSIEKATNATKLSNGCADALSDLAETVMQNNTLLKNIQKSTAWMTVAIGPNNINIYIDLDTEINNSCTLSCNIQKEYET